MYLTTDLQNKIVDKQTKQNSKGNYLDNEQRLKDEEELSLFEIFNSYRLTSELMKQMR